MADQFQVVFEQRIRDQAAQSAQARGDLETILDNMRAQTPGTSPLAAPDVAVPMVASGTTKLNPIPEDWVRLVVQAGSLDLDFFQEIEAKASQIVAARFGAVSTTNNPG